MMKKQFGLMALILATSIGSAAAAAIGVINIDKVVEQSTYLKQQTAAFQQRVQPQRTQLESLGKELQGLQQRMQAGAQLSDADKQKLIGQYQAKMAEFEKTQQNLQSLAQSNSQTIHSTFDLRLKQAAEQLRKENNLDVILNKNSTFASDARYDLTDKMIQKVNAIK